MDLDVDTTLEWAILWPANSSETFGDEIETGSEGWVRRTAAKYVDVGAEVVCRDVTRSPWRTAVT